MVESKRKQYIRVLRIAANHADDGMITVSVDEVREIIDLLTEQEPRVMTLEELQSMETWNQNTPPYLWVEGITERDSRWNYWRAIRTALRLPGTMGVQNYGSVWRVWNLQPTPEQMRDTPWEGEKDDSN